MISEINFIEKILSEWYLVRAAEVERALRLVRHHTGQHIVPEEKTEEQRDQKNGVTLS